MWVDGKEGEVDVNIFNFEKEEPKAFMYDLTSCYNESYSKNYVLTFPANDLVRDTEKDLRNPIHQTIKSVTEVSKQRIFISEVVFSGKYMYAEFKILARPDVLKKSKTTLKESTLDEAVEKLKAAVSANKFIVPIMVKDKEVFFET
ncbi:uncharacterized protein CEXT_774641 [Caerostris extrusa]|uniref:DUF7959 domain-containing protein n=1 Tax=Caerostris extrusa TaxID=172846 RepID=A0AAV4VGP5_CAEEX|nr:uncharacterized protein CEXT_774641 [Caerostris extrusa]